ncbi:MAG: methyltransferase domain-containing protein [Bacteroidota bacterium]
MKNRGLFFTFRLMYNEWYWERKLGIKSMKIELLPEEIKSVEFKNEQFHHYQGASYYITMETLKNLPAESLSSGFIDFGCGKGRVMVLAAISGFKKVLGIDMDDSLLKIARINTDSYLKRVENKIEFLIEHADASRYLITDSSSVLFFFNPFGEQIMRDVLKNLKRSIEIHPRKIWIVYVNPKFLFVWIEAGFNVVYSLESKRYKESVILELPI